MIFTLIEIDCKNICPIFRYVNYLKENREELSEYLLMAREYSIKLISLVNSSNYTHNPSLKLLDEIIEDIFDNTFYTKEEIESYLKNFARENSDCFADYFQDKKEEFSENITKTYETIKKINKLLDTKPYFFELTKLLPFNECGDASMFTHHFLQVIKFIYSGQTDAELLADSMQLTGGKKELIQFITGFNIFSEEQLREIENSFEP